MFWLIGSTVASQIRYLGMSANVLLYSLDPETELTSFVSL